MHVHDLRPFRHDHAFGDHTAPRRERALWWVTWITLATMALELAAGYWSGSLALVADGWHMGTHALALGGAALAAHFSRRVAGSQRFAFGGWKIEVLAAYTSGLLLLAWACGSASTRCRRCAAARRGLRRGDGVAVLGLAVNLACAVILARAGGQGMPMPTIMRTHTAIGARRPHHACSPGGHRDHNFAAAYLHVVADAFTSVLAIAALAGGLWWGLGWLDPAVALIGAVVIGRWAVGVLRHSGRALVDASAPTRGWRRRSATLIEGDGDAKLADLHVWQVGPEAYAAALSIVADRPQACDAYGQRLRAIDALQHATIEVHRCPGARVEPT